MRTDDPSIVKLDDLKFMIATMSQVPSVAVTCWSVSIVASRLIQPPIPRFYEVWSTIIPASLSQLFLFRRLLSAPRRNICPPAFIYLFVHPLTTTAIFKTLKKNFRKKERAQVYSGPFLYNVSMMDVARKEWVLALEQRGRSAASTLVDADESIVAPSDDASSLLDIIEEMEKDAMGLRILSTGLNASRHRDVAAESAVLCLITFGYSSNKSAV
ncbi:hypothetical protein FIBSPDRAFT_961403 [Athelia psychrophila]|uniref:Uncharacterized protein n=1 Tax=Athelia psychrophila TaxID=1759441 RepID=A0A166BAY7_9AGAM|nr:hypothetical protein FIBSPDRAFT_961403 [Fibularhizoctonia sp. CBS 109695]